MPWKLDRKREFSEIWGLGGIAGYLQDGIEFDSAGEPLPGQFPHGKEAKAAKKAKTSAGSLDDPGEAIKAFVPPPLETFKRPVGGYAAMDDETLRGLIEVRGDQWMGREAALATLEDY